MPPKPLKAAPKKPHTRTAYRADVGDKAARGAKNILFGWTELPKKIIERTRETDPVTGVLSGAWEGVVKSFARTAAGIADLATFPVAGTDKTIVPKALE